MYTTGKEKLADYLGISADEARNVMHSFLGPFLLVYSFILIDFRFYSLCICICMFISVLLSLVMNKDACIYCLHMAWCNAHGIV